MRQREGERIPRSGNRAREHGCPDGQAEEAPVEEWLDVILRPALKLALGDAEPATAVWTKIREAVEARRREPSTGEEE
ncbi:MAG TPA: hypothetical protein VM075_01000 [Anaerolineae bacterium]|nr:hypothetical protein [Anaerolineae bacterium]